ncbi:hypothetical protein WICPIJ_003858 [Wickerhamomyces pijperi]|uniref:Uncharacterized protein n=1 Tax=Wickerhamomyces pijperi TaxID=599730 RepID=A0A9P8Q919_WICPI|nr:hypothetical protein WICPIJ_003858 [Wickerhamomyces pijperi]
MYVVELKVGERLELDDVEVVVVDGCGCDGTSVVGNKLGLGQNVEVEEVVVVFVGQIGGKQEMVSRSG